MVNLGPLASEIRSLVWSTPSNFNGFRVLASLLHRHHSPEANQTLHNVWPSLGLLQYIYIFEGSCPITELRQVQNSLCVEVLRSAILAALLHGTRVVGISQTAALSRRRLLYSTGRPSHWALAHILVCLFFLFVCHSNISQMVERICAKFTEKTCLVPCSDKFER